MINFLFHIIFGSRSNISIDLITKLSPCHPGFQLNNETQNCVCVITIMICLVLVVFHQQWQYVLTIIEILPPVKLLMDFTVCHQWDLINARSGTACGSCKKGHTLSFDSIECVANSKCTVGWTAHYQYSIGHL